MNCATNWCRSIANIPLRELLEACRNYPASPMRGRITFEYVMLKGVNDSLADAKALVRLLKGIPAKINLIRQSLAWHHIRCSDWAADREILRDQFSATRGYSSPVGTPRGPDILPLAAS